MEKINSEASLKAAILQLEIMQTEEGKMLKEQFHQAYESIKPINLIKSTFHQLAASEDIKDNIINTSVGLAAGYLAEKLVEGMTSGPFKKLLGAAVMFGVTNVVAKNPETVKSLGKGVLKIMFSESGASVNRVGTCHKETAS